MFEEAIHVLDANISNAQLIRANLDKVMFLLNNGAFLGTPSRVSLEGARVLVAVFPLANIRFSLDGDHPKMAVTGYGVDSDFSLYVKADTTNWGLLKEIVSGFTNETTY